MPGRSRAGLTAAERAVGPVAGAVAQALTATGRDRLSPGEGAVEAILGGPLVGR